ncbi:MAG: hypothetical protein IJJ26_07015 [Victivallales bacterium]|nr:hypothetical protein [Victivallales bacterium]
MDIQNLLATMTLEDKVGQICVPILQKGEIEDDIRKCVTEYHVGMLRFCPNANYDGNSEIIGEPNRYRTAGEMAEFLNSAQKLSRIPLFISVDQEGSIRNDVNRAGAFAYSGHMSFGAANDTDLTYRVAKATGEEFAAMGINLVQAPIVDVITYSGRKTMKSASFGQDVQKVTAHALAMMRGYQEAGIASMAKHFPGYGSVATDAHKGLAEIVKSFEELDSTDIHPMKALFAAGVNGVMTGHVLTHAIDEEYPATLSRKMITGYLREKLGFEGIVETDAMRMPAIQSRYGTGQASVMAIQAGCDLVLLRGDLNHFEEGYFALLTAVKDGTIPMSTLDAAVTRILRQKERIGLLGHPLVDPVKADAIVGCAAHKELARELAERSVTLLRNADLPLGNAGKVLTICVEPQKILGANDPVQSIDMLYKAVSPIYGGDCFVTKLRPTAEQIASIRAAVPQYDTVILGTCNALLYPEQVELANVICEGACGKVIVVAMDGPYDYEVLPNVKNLICTYGAVAASCEAAVDVIRGKLKGDAFRPITLKP